MVIKAVAITEAAQKDLRKAPQNVASKLLLWANAEATIGLEEVRKIPGYHDEPLKGDRKGQRSIRLNLQWRAIYVIRPMGRCSSSRSKR